MNNSLITNPFIVYSWTWVLVLIVYGLGWSGLFPPLSSSLLFFLAVTIIISGFIGLFAKNACFFPYSKVSNINLKKIGIKLFFLYILLFIEFINVRTVPILEYITGDHRLEYTEFGMPFLHVVIVNFFSFLFIYCYHCYRSTNVKELKKKLLIFLFLSLFPAFLIFNRGMFMACFFGAIMVYLMSIKIRLKQLISILILALGVLWVFGSLGNLRTDAKGLNNVIMDFGQATPEFRKSSIPDDFFWGYIYIASPLSNLQNTINKDGDIKITSDSFIGYILSELTPTIISKRVDPMVSFDKKEVELIIPAFNVSTVYGGSYAYLGWFGMITTFCFMILFILVNLILVPRSSPFFVSMVAIVNSIIFLNLFANMFTFMGMVPQLVFPVVLGLDHSFKRFKKSHK